MEEVRDVMAQYTACADPSESAERKERLRVAEAQGEIEETSIRMVQASMTIPAAREPQLETSPRIPAVLRLGPPIHAETRSEGNPEPSSKRKPGRPPGKKKAHASPLKLTGSVASRRRASTKTQANKRKVGSATTQPTRATNSGISKGGGARPQTTQTISNQSFENRPISTLLPPRSRKKMGFHNPSTLVT